MQETLICALLKLLALLPGRLEQLAADREGNVDEAKLAVYSVLWRGRFGSTYGSLIQRVPELDYLLMSGECEGANARQTADARLVPEEGTSPKLNPRPLQVKHCTT